MGEAKAAQAANVDKIAAMSVDDILKDENAARIRHCGRCALPSR